MNKSTNNRHNFSALDPIINEITHILSLCGIWGLYPRYLSICLRQGMWVGVESREILYFHFWESYQFYYSYLLLTHISTTLYANLFILLTLNLLHYSNIFTKKNDKRKCLLVLAPGYIY